MRDLTFIVISLLLSSVRALSQTPFVYNVDLSQFEEDDVDDFDEGYGPKGDDDDEIDNTIGDQGLYGEVGDFLEDRVGQAGNCGRCQKTCDGVQTITLGQPQDSTVICSKNYPGKYPKKQNCKIDIQAPEDTWVKLTFCDFSVHYSKACKNDRFVVLDRAMSDNALGAPCENKVQRTRKFCGVQTGKVYHMKSPFARFVFKTNNDNQNRRGFRISIQTVASPCYFQLQPPNGIITAHANSHADDTDYPASAGAEYRSNYYCKWNYNYGHSVNEAFQMKCDKFNVHQGISYADISPDCVRLIGTDGSPSYYTGVKGPSHVSLGGNVSLEFFTNRQIQRTGFTCKWTINPPGSLSGFCLHPLNCQDRLTCVSEMCECDTAAGYTEISYNGQKVCSKSVALGGSCVHSYDCAGSDANADCLSGKCACKSTHVVVQGSCKAKVGMNGVCSGNAQCVLTQQCNNGRCRCNNGRCGCQSGMETTTCAGSRGKGCFPALNMPTGGAGKVFSMPNLNNNLDFKFCIYGFKTGNFYFQHNPRKGVKWTFTKSAGRNNLIAYRKKGTAWQKMNPTLTYGTNPNPDYFRYTKVGTAARLRRGNNGGVISSVAGVAPPNGKWNQFYLWSSRPYTNRKIVFIG